MISGSRSSCILILSLLALALPASAHDADAFNALMNALAAVDRSRVAYTEVKYMAILDEPVRQSGVLEYVAPDTVIRDIRVPEPETYSISDTTMVAVRRGKHEEIDLGSVPMLAAFVEAFRATLSGSVAVLEDYYEVDFRYGAAGWELRLQPREKSLAKFVSSVRFAGDGTRIDEIVVHEANGDRSEMRLTPLLDDG